MSKLVLKINQTSYSGFEYVDLYKSMLNMAGSFSLSLNNAFKGTNEIFDIKRGDSCSVEIEGQKVISGYVDDIHPRYGRNFNWIDIVGRDKTEDLIDCSYDFTPNEWKNQSVGNIIKTICKSFSIDVTIDKTATAEAATILETFKANEGQYVYDIISELCRDYAILPLCYGDGKLTLTKATTDKYTSDGIIGGVNIEGAYGLFSNANRYSSYKVKGQGIGNDNKALADYISCVGSFKDTVVTRTRPLVLFSDLPTNTGACSKRAIWESRLRAGMSCAIEYQVSKWVQENNKIWEINNLTKVKDPMLNIDMSMLIIGLRYVYTKDEGEGEITKITVASKDMFNIASNEILIKTGYDK